MNIRHFLLFIHKKVQELTNSKASARDLNRGLSRCGLLNLFVYIPILFCACTTRYAAYSPEPVPEYSLPKEPIRLALCLGSGGSRGIAHLGVLYELEKANIPIDLIVGCSAGSVIGASYADHPHVEDLIPKFKQQKKDHLLDMDMLNMRYGIYKGSAFQNFLMNHLKSTCFEELKIPCLVVATDMISGEELCFGSGPLAPIIHASCAIPYYFHPVEIYGRYLIDGGVTNPVPTSIAKKHGAGLIIAVDITFALPTNLPTNLLGIAKRSMEICFHKVNKLCLEQADIVITPDIKTIGVFEDQAFDLLFEAGRASAREAIPEIQSRLDSLKRNPAL
jgi:NTE family protein